jgi:hypothetical protein
MVVGGCDTADDDGAVLVAAGKVYDPIFCSPAI